MPSERPCRNKGYSKEGEIEHSVMKNRQETRIEGLNKEGTEER